MRVLAVLALVAGIAAMHSVTSDHASSAAAVPVAASAVHGIAHGAPDSEPTSRISDPRASGAPCHLSCAPADLHIANICLAVLGGVGGCALLLLASGRRGRAAKVPRGLLTGLVAYRRPALVPPSRPPSPLVLCVSRT